MLKNSVQHKFNIFSKKVNMLNCGIGYVRKNYFNQVNSDVFLGFDLQY